MSGIKTATRGQVHRFRDHVAVWLGEGETVYLTAKQARSLAGAIDGAARSIEFESFAASKCGTFTLPAAEDEANGNV